MPHISSKDLDQKTYQRISHRMHSVFAGVKTASHAKDFTESFFTKTECVMLAKRMMAVIMILEEFSPYRIHSVLKISISTVRRLERVVDRGGFSYFKKQIHTRRQREAVWKDIETLLRFGLPPRGRGRWAWLRDMK